MNRPPLRAVLLGAALALTLCAPASAVELLRWQRLPLPVALVVGQERVIFLDEPVRVGLPAPLAQTLRVQSAGGALYLRAAAPLGPTRVQLQAQATGELILLDISAGPGEVPLEPLRILTGEAAQAEPDGPSSTEPAATPLPVALTRYAAQSLYAPLRTLEPLPGVRRVPLGVQGELPGLLPGEAVSSTPLLAWRLGDYWLTAIKLRNRGPRPVLLDPRQLQARLYAAGFQHADLGPAGTPQDTTVAYLITQGGGLEQALLLPAVGGPADER